MSENQGKAWLRLWPFLILAILAVVFILMLIFSRKAPVIASLDPAMAAPGQQVVVVGDYFGRTEREGSLSLSGEIPPPSLILSWTDQKIVFLVPEDASSGLVTVSNSQGTSTGILFTNTKSIPTVLQSASAPGVPLIIAVVPPEPQGGQTVTLSGRGFGTGNRQSFVKLSTGKTGPVMDFPSSDCVNWSDRSISFRWPAGAGPESTVKVTTPQGETPVFPLAAISALSFENPQTIQIEVKISVPVSSGAVVFWGPVPQSTSGTSWTLDSAEPAPMAPGSPLVFRWSAGAGGDQRAVYRLSLTSWTKKWEGFPPGTLATGGDPPRPDARPLGWWKAALPALKTLTAKWGLDTSDPWLRVQRIQNGITTAFRFGLGADVLAGLSRTPSQILASGTLDSLEASSLAAVLAGQAGVPVRLVTGLWVADDHSVRPRVWNEVWLNGAGWVPWDPLTGPPGSLDNRHFAFETEFSPPTRLEPRARILSPPSPLSQGELGAEAVVNGAEPVVQWEIRRTEK